MNQNFSVSSNPISAQTAEYQPDDLLLPKETANVLCVTEGTLAVWRSTGRYALKFVKVGRYVRYRWRDVTAFMDQRTHTQVS